MDLLKTQVQENMIIGFLAESVVEEWEKRASASQKVVERSSQKSSPHWDLKNEPGFEEVLRSGNGIDQSVEMRGSQAGLVKELQGFQGAEGQVKLEELHSWMGSGPGALLAVQRNADLILCVEKPSAD